MAFFGTLWKMFDKNEEFVLLVVQHKLERHLNELIPLLGNDPITFESINLDK
jgi:hypothetical protein